MLGLSALLGLALSGCSYSFQTVSLPPEVNTFYVERFQNNAPIIVPSLAQDFTIALQDQFIRQTRLKLDEPGADLEFSGTITNYNVSPVNVQSDNTAAQNRLTIGMSVKFVNNVVPSDSWEQSFSNFADWPQSAGSLAAVEDQLIDEITERLVQDIFNKALGNW